MSNSWYATGNDKFVIFQFYYRYLMRKVYNVQSTNIYNLLKYYCNLIVHVIASLFLKIVPGRLSIPGPVGLPIFGYLPFLGSHPHIKLNNLSKVYGKTFQIGTPVRRLIIVNSIKTVREMEEKYSLQLVAKQRTFTMTKLKTLGNHNDELTRWRRRRAYTMAAVERLKNTVTNKLIGAEVARLLSLLKELISSSDGCYDINEAITITVCRITYKLCYGDSIDDDINAILSKAISLIPHYTKANTVLGKFNHLPLLRYWNRDEFWNYLDYCEFITSFCMSESSKVTKEGSLKQIFEEKIKSMTDRNKSILKLNEELMLGGIEDIIRATTESGSLVVRWFLLYMAAYPEKQDLVRSEIEQFLSEKRKTTIEQDDVDQLHYCQAALYETLRFSSLPVFINREADGDLFIDQYFVPKGTGIVINTWSINNDSEIFNKPELFLPERFLDSDGELDKESLKKFLPYGFGKRRCAGEALGIVIYSLVALTVILNYNVEPANGAVDLSTTFGMSITPKTQKLKFCRIRL